MNGKLILDTNVVIYALPGDRHIAELINGEKLALSFITEIELLSWPRLSQKDVQLVQRFISSCRLIDYSSTLKDQVIIIRKKYGLKMSDAFIAATAILDESPLISADGIFSKVEELQFFLVKPKK